MFDNLCTLPLTSDLFAQALHPKEPILAIGLASGHVHSFRLPPSHAVAAIINNTSIKNNSNSTAKRKSSITKKTTTTAAAATARRGTIETLWRTRRHKGSCRTLAFAPDGAMLVSAGGDAMVKMAEVETGRVVAKIAVPGGSSPSDHPSLVYLPSPQTLLLATDSSALHIYDLRIPLGLSPRPQQTYRPHDDYISSLTPLPRQNDPTAFPQQWVTTGGTTLAVTDLRRGVLSQSEAQDDDLLCSTFLPRQTGGRGPGGQMVIGGAAGVLTLWDRGAWDDQTERVVVGREAMYNGDGRGRASGGEELEALEAVAVIPEAVGLGTAADVVVGLGDGRLAMVTLGRGKKTVLDWRRHHDIEGVVAVGFDVFGRMVTGGGACVKVWEPCQKEEEEEDEEDEEEEEEEGKEIEKETANGANGANRTSRTNTKNAKEPRKRQEAEGSKGGEVEEEEDASDEEKSSQRAKKKRKPSGKAGKKAPIKAVTEAFAGLD